MHELDRPKFNFMNLTWLAHVEYEEIKISILVDKSTSVHVYTYYIRNNMY